MRVSERKSEEEDEDENMIEEDENMKEEDENIKEDDNENIKEDDEIENIKENVNPSAGPPVSKKAEDRKDVKIGEEENSNDPPISRKQLYDEAFQEIRISQAAIEKARDKVEQLNQHVEDLHCMEVMSCVDEASNQLEEALTSLQQSSKHWVSFLAIPEVPMRHILKYLNFKDKANFRLSSQDHRDIVDCFDDDFKSVKIDVHGHRRVSEEHELPGTQKDIKFICVNERCHVCDRFDQVDIIVQDCLSKIPDKLIELSLSPKFIEHTPNACKLEKIRLEDGKCYAHQILHVNKFANSLRVLELVDVRLPISGFQGLFLPNLEKLELQNVRRFSCAVQLLFASCSSSLKHLSVKKIDEAWNFANLLESGTIMTRLKKIVIIGCPRMTGIISLVKSASNRLETLHIRDCEEKFSAEPDSRLPNLEKLILESCHPGFLSILTGSVPRLKTVILRDMLLFADFQLNHLTSLTRLKISGGKVMERGPTILAAAAANVEELDICDSDLAGYINTFPKLRRVQFSNCDASLKADILCRSPCLKELDLGNSKSQPADYLDHVDLSGIEKLGISSGQSLREVNVLFSQVADSLREFAISGLDVPTLEVNRLKLTKLSVHCSSRGPGLCDLLNACSSTLEELCISSSFSEQPLNLQGLQVMQVLKIITIVSSGGKESKNEIRSDGFTKLLKQSNKSLEKLVLKFNPWLLKKHLLTEILNLPNLKILHIYPRPADSVVKQISRHLSENVTLWWFPPF